MHAVTIQEQRLVWAERPDPQPGHHELLVSVRSAALNAADLMQVRGLYPAPPGVPPDIPGMDLAGQVVALGPHATGFGVGDRVMAVVGGGAQAELAVVPEAHALRVPDSIPWEEAGGFPEVFSTAYDALLTQCEMSLGDKVLVTGAAGGVGTAAVQLGAATGAWVVASVRSEKLRHAVEDLGATAALSPEEALGAGPFDVALELVGGASLPSVISAMALGGRISVIGVGSGSKAELSLLDIMQRRLRLSGSTLRARSLLEKGVVAARVQAHVVPLLGTSRVRVPVQKTFPMERAADAYSHFAESGKLGKIVLLNEHR